MPVGSSAYRTTYFEYNDPINPNLLTRQINPNGSTTQMTYNAQGDLATVTDDHQSVTTYVYAEDIAEQTQQPLNPKHRHLLRKIIRPAVTVDGQSVQYDPTELEYDSNGNLVLVRDALGQEIHYSVRGDGLVESITDRAGGIANFTYDTSSLNLTMVSVETDPSPAPARTLTMGYDDRDNVISVTDDLGNQVASTFDDTSRLIQSRDGNLQDVFYSYDEGLLRQVEAPSNQGSGTSRRRSQLHYDGSRRLQDVQAETASNSFEMRVGYNYTGYSELKQLLRPAGPSPKHTDYSYDLVGRLSQAKDFLGRITQWTYAPFCTETTRQSPRGISETTNFDTLCRLVHRKTQEEEFIYEYDELSRLIAVTHGDLYGEAHLAAVSSVSRGWRYDSLDRVVEASLEGGQSVAYEYDPEGRVSQMTDVHGKVSTYTYYLDGRLKTLTQNSQTFTYTYDLAGRLQSLQYPVSTQLVASFTKADGSTGWDANRQLLSVRYLRNGSLVRQFAYSYDASGNRVTQVETSPGGTVTWGYAYDWLNRLTGVTLNGSTRALYGHDAADNRITLEIPSTQELWSYGYDLADQLLSRSRSVSGGASSLIESFEHDDDGNMIARTEGGVTTNYDWSSTNHLRQIRVGGVVQERAAYDADGIRRLREDGGKERFFDSGSMPLADLKASGSQISYLQGHQLLGFQADGTFYYYITDGLGSVRAVTDSTGNVAATMDFDEFGSLMQSTGSSDLQGLGYVGGLGVRSDSSALLYMRQRYYESSLGRWLSADPVGFAGGLNLYNYVGNNPATLVDPSGLVPGRDYGEMIAPRSAAGLERRDRDGGLACKVIFGDERTRDEFMEFTFWTLAIELGIPMLARGAAGFTLPRGTGGTLGGNRRGGMPGGGRGPGILELSATSRTAGNFANLPRKPMEFIFDGERLVTGPMKHNDLADRAGMCGNLRGGTIWQQGGKIFTNEMSGSFHQNWNDQTRQQFKAFMSEQGVLIQHQLGF